jgi:hypothetical protein
MSNITYLNIQINEDEVNTIPELTGNNTIIVRKPLLFECQFIVSSKDAKIKTLSSYEEIMKELIKNLKILTNNLKLEKASIYKKTITSVPK